MPVATPTMPVNESEVSEWVMIELWAMIDELWVSDYLTSTSWGVVDGVIFLRRTSLPKWEVKSVEIK